MNVIAFIIALLSLLGLFWLFKKNAAPSRRTRGFGTLSTEFAARQEKAEAQNEAMADAEMPEGQANSTDIADVNRLYRIAEMHFSRGNFEEAEKSFIKVLAQQEDHTEAMNRLGVIYIQQGNSRRAEMLYRTLLSVTQREPAYYCNYGRCLYNQGRFDEAIEAYENAIKLDSTRPTRYVSLGQIHYERKNYPQSLVYFIRALELDPTNTEYLSLTAELAELTGDMERLHKSLKKILDIDPYNEVAKQKLAAVDRSA